MKIKENVIIKAITFRGNKIYLPTVLLFWYFVAVLVILFIPFFSFTLPILIGNFLSPILLLDFLLTLSPLGKFLLNFGLTEYIGGFLAYYTPTFIGYIIIFSICLLFIFLFNYILGKFFIIIFKIKK